MRTNRRGQCLDQGLRDHWKAIWEEFQEERWSQVADGAPVQKLGFVVKSKKLKLETEVHTQMQSQTQRCAISPSLGWHLEQRLAVSTTAHGPGTERGVAAVMLQRWDHWVSVGQGQALDQKREREIPPGGPPGPGRVVWTLLGSYGCLRVGQHPEQRVDF